MNEYSVLVIDDDEDIRHTFNHILKSGGYDVYDSVDGYDTVKTLKTILPDVLLLDLTMPNMDGFEFLKHIRQSGFTAPIIVVTGRPEEGLEETTLKLGANGFLRKPVSPEKILKLVAQVIGESSSSKTLSIAR